MRLDRYKNHDIEVVIDKLRVQSKDEERLKKSVRQALQQGDGLMLILDADMRARDVVALGTEGLKAIVTRFGEQVLAPDGSLNRRALAGIVFADPQARADLNAIIHPRVRERALELEAAAVRDGRLYYYDVTRFPNSSTIKSHGAAHARNLGTGETITISENDSNAFDDIDNSNNTDARPLYTDQHDVILWSRTSGTDPSSFSVWKPDQTTPTLSWKKAEQAIPTAACVFGDVVYTVGGPLRLVSLSSGEELSEVPGKAWNWSTRIAVTAWGLAVGSAFYPATEWFDS